MTFGDPILGGNVLIRDAIQSTNYNPGIAGWAVNSDGTAQFNQVSIIGNDLKVIGTNGSQVEIHQNGAQSEMDLLPPSQVGHTSQAGLVSAFVQSPGLTPVLMLQAPTLDNLTPGSVTIASEDASGGLIAPSLMVSTPGGVVTLDAAKVFLSDTPHATQKQAWMLTAADDFDCNAALALGGAFAVISGCGHTYNNLRPGTKWTATLNIDVTLNATAGNKGIGQLTVNANAAGAVAQVGNASFGPVTSGGGQGSRSWSGVFAAGGTLAFSANGALTGPGGVGCSINSPNTALNIAIYE